MTTLALGLMSGTSADGVSAALGAFGAHSFKLIGHLTDPYPPQIRERIRRANTLSAAELSSLNVEIGEAFAKAAIHLFKKTKIKATKVACVGSHGQTIYHGPRDKHPNTLQIGEPAVIAEKTGIPVISHFRQKDIAAGGEGAPLIPFFDHFFFGNGSVRAFQNIGGISNVTVVGKGIKSPIAFDNGPGNGLMDAAVRLITRRKESLDAQGKRAERGSIDLVILHAMMKTPYFKKAPPKSTGLELFGENFVKQYFGRRLVSHPNDVLATLNFFTALTIQESYKSFVFPKHHVSEIVVSGGGIHNTMLMKNLASLFAPIPVKRIDAFGIPSQAKEPLTFAFFGLRAFQNKINHIPACTGAKRACVLGSLTR